MKYVLVLLFYVIRFHFLIINFNVNFFSSSEDGKHKITMKMFCFRVPETKYIL